MRRLGVAPTLIDFKNEAINKIGTWFESVTERFNIQKSTVSQTTTTIPENQWGIFKNTTTGDVHLIANDDAVLRYLGGPVAATAVTASGTAVDFTSIPPGVKRITVLYNGVSLNAADAVITQLGDSGGPENTGYASLAVNINTGATPVIMASVTNGFGFTAVGAGSALTGALIIHNVNDNNWVATGWARISATAANYLTCTGSKTLSGTLDRVRVTGSAGGSFDAGTINILYE
jgi:hypothetical protein